jgi:hypothetical protein
MEWPEDSWPQSREDVQIVTLSQTAVVTSMGGTDGR